MTKDGGKIKVVKIRNTIFRDNLKIKLTLQIMKVTEKENWLVGILNRRGKGWSD